jgi:hypothetical protein
MTSMRNSARRAMPVGVLLLLLLSSPPESEAQVAGPTSGCSVCHEELELLRQRTGSLEEGSELLVDMDRLEASVHGALTCADCHSGFTTFPHAERPYTSSRSCSSCHGDARAEWGESVHSAADDAGADCRACHGTHDVQPVDALLEVPEAAVEMNRRCTGCHETAGLPPSDPHSEAMPCSGCHGSHDITPVDDLASSVGPERQGDSCGACHQDQHSAWADGAHGSASGGSPFTTSPGPISEDGEEGHRDRPACGACHTPHNTLAMDDPGFALVASDLCKSCHHEYADTYMDSYHGQATTLGSRASATCISCHSAHDVFPASDPRSMVHEANLVETCAQCHPAAGESFVAFAPHADHKDRENFPLVYWTYRLMTMLLIGVFTVFGIHTALWLLRLTVFADGAPADSAEEEG